MDQTHVTFRWKDRTVNRWRTERLEGVAFLRRFLQHVLPRGFHKVRYYGLWHSSKRSQSNRAWVLLTLEGLVRTPEPLRLADLLQALSQGTQEPDQPDATGAQRRPPQPRVALPCVLVCRLDPLMGAAIPCIERPRPGRRRAFLIRL
jgi:Putative transposase